MRKLRAPSGCLQYYSEPSGKASTINPSYKTDKIKNDLARRLRLEKVIKEKSCGSDAKKLRFLLIFWKSFFSLTFLYMFKPQ